MPTIDEMSELLREKGLKPLKPLYAPTTTTRTPTTSPIPGSPRIAGEDYASYADTKVLDPHAENYSLPGTLTDEEYNQVKADRQGFGDELGNAALRFIPKVGLQILETAGNIGDLENWGGAMGIADTNYQNWLSTWSKDTQGEVDKALPLYRQNPNATFDATDTAWWVENGSSLIESAAAFAATGYGIGAGLKTLSGSLLAAAPRLASAINASSQAVSTLALTHAEGVMTGADVYKRVIQDKLEKQQGLAQGTMQLSNSDVAEMPIDEDAAAAAATAVRFNYLNAGLNYTALTPIFKKAKYSRAIDEAEDLAVLKMGVGETLEKFAARTAAYKPTSLYNTIVKHGIEAGQEALEEGINVWAQNKGLAQAGLIKDEDAELLNSLFSDEGLLSMALGAVGGVAQTGIIHAITKGAGAGEREKEYNNRRNQVMANYGEQGVNFVKAVSAIGGLTKGLAQAQSHDDVEAAKFYKDQIIDNLAYNNFANGTTTSLVNMLKEEGKKSKEQFIAEKKLEPNATDDDYLNYKESVSYTESRIKQEEKLFNKAMDLGQGISPGYAFDLFNNLSANKSLVYLANDYKLGSQRYLAKLQQKLTALNIPFTFEDEDIKVEPKYESLLEDLEERVDEREMAFRADDASKSLLDNQKRHKELMSTAYRKKIQKAYKEESAKAILATKDKLKKAKTKVDNKTKVEKADPIPTNPVPSPSPTGAPQVSETIIDESNLTVPTTPGFTTPPPIETSFTTPPPVEETFTTPPAADMSLNGDIKHIFDTLNDVDFDPEVISPEKRNYIIDMFSRVIMPKAQAEGIVTPEAMVNYMIKAVGKAEVAKWYDTIINPLMVMSYANSEFKNKTLEQVYVDPVLDSIDPPFNVQDVLNGEFYGLTDAQWKQIERNVREAVANITSLDKDGAIRDAKGVLTYLNLKLVNAFNKIAYSSREYSENVEDLTFSIDNASDSLDPSENWNPNILSNKMYNEGTGIVLRVVPESEFVSYKDRNGNLVTYESIVKNNPENVPIVIEDKDGNKLGYLHTEDYIRPTRIVEIIDDEDNIAKNKAELSKLRKAIIAKGKLNATIDSKTLGVLFTTKTQEVASKRLIQPKIAFALTSSNLSFSDKGTVSQDISDNILNSKDFMPGMAYYLAETQGKYLAIPLYRMKLEGNPQIMGDINKALTAYFTGDTSIANPRDYNANDPNQVKDFLEQYLFLKHNLEDSFTTVLEENKGKVYIDFDSKSGTLAWGQSGSRVYTMYKTPKGNVQMSYKELQSNGSWVTVNKNLTNEEMEKVLSGIMSDYVSKMLLNLSAKKLGEGEFTHRKFEDGKVLSTKMDYKDFLLEHSLTNVKDHKLPDGSVTAFHQKTIGFTTNQTIPTPPTTTEQEEISIETPPTTFKSKRGFTYTVDTNKDMDPETEQSVLERIKNCVNL